MGSPGQDATRLACLQDAISRSFDDPMGESWLGKGVESNRVSSTAG